jgi:hypothetical protein
MTSAAGAALFRAATQPDFTMPRRGTTSSNETNGSINQLIWTALILYRICSEHSLGMLNYSEPRSEGFT